MIRVFDIILSSISIIVLLPILIPIMLLLRITGEGEIFFSQKRVGQFGRTFDLYKFATMLKDSPNMGSGTLTLKNDPRILPLGRFLRKTKVNELPQLVNVIFGQMSLIGPRPLTQQTYDSYSENVKSVISTITPGLSGIQQVIVRDEENLLGDSKNSEEFYKTVLAPYKGRLELWFVNNRSIKNYFLLIIVTVHVIIARNSSLAWKIFKELPTPPKKLKTALDYSLH